MRDLSRFLLVFIILVGVLSPTWADDSGEAMPSFITASVPHAKIVGQGTLRYLLWDVYEATLYAPDGLYSPNSPLALKLDYGRSVDAGVIAASSIHEIEHEGFHNQAKLEKWRQQMSVLFQDVHEHTVLTGIYLPQQKTCFFHDNDLAGCIEDVEFGPLFFNIWLGSTTSEPRLRETLLGQNQ